MSRESGLNPQGGESISFTISGDTGTQRIAMSNALALSLIFVSMKRRSPLIESVQAQIFLS